MSISAGDILFFNEYLFTDTGETKPHYALALLPQSATKYQSNLFCCVITSREPRVWGMLLLSKRYPCFSKDSYSCFNRKDLVPAAGLSENLDTLKIGDRKKAFKILKKSLYVIKDTLGDDAFMRAVIIREWKKTISAWGK